MNVRAGIVNDKTQLANDGSLPRKCIGVHGAGLLLNLQGAAHRFPAGRGAAVPGEWRKFPTSTRFILFA